MGQTPAWLGSWTSVTGACFRAVSICCIVAFAAAPAQGEPWSAPNTANPTQQGARTTDDGTRLARILRELPPHPPLVPKAGATVWTATQWKSSVHVMSGCPRQLPRQDVMSEWSIRQHARLVWQDNGRCTGTGHLDAGTCLNQSGQIRCFPSFIVFGTAKGGTAELQSWLSKHPNLMRYGDPLSLKGGGEADYFGRELESRDHMEHTWREYLGGFAPQSLESIASVYTFEKSPGYLAHARDPHLLGLLLPSVRLIAILRDPAKRAYSHFQMGCHREKKMQKFRVNGRKVDKRVEVHNVSGVFRDHKNAVTKFPYCSPADFDNYIRLVGPNTLEPAGLFATGHYATDLKRWAHAIPSTRTLVLFYEDFAANAIGVVEEIQRFLGVPHLSYSNLTEQRAGSNLTFLKGVPSKRKGLRYESMSSSAASILNKHYASHTAALVTYLGLDRPPRGWGAG